MKVARLTLGILHRCVQAGARAVGLKEKKVDICVSYKNLGDISKGRNHVDRCCAYRIKVTLRGRKLGYLILNLAILPDSLLRQTENIFGRMRPHGGRLGRGKVGHVG